MRVIRFESFEVNLQEETLRNSGVRVRLQPQPFLILATLLERPGELVTRAELRDHLWDPNVFVDYDHSLNRAVNRLRIALNDSADSPRMIETIPGRGYRFIASVTVQDNDINDNDAALTRVNPLGTYIGNGSVKTELPGDQSPPIPKPDSLSFMRNRFGIVLLALLICGFATATVLRSRQELRGTHLVKRIVVLPVLNLTEDSQLERVADGLTEDIITGLDIVGNHRLGVVARTSSMKYKGSTKGASEIGKELNADYVLESSVRRSGKNYRVVAQLIRSSDEQDVWSATFDRDETDPLVLSSEISLSIADEVAPQIAGKLEQTRRASVRAAEYAYIKGHYHWNKRTKEEVEESLADFKEAARLDPSYALAYSGMSEAYLVLGGGYWPSAATYEQARTMALKALSLDEGCANAHAALGYIKFVNDYDWQGAEQEFRKATELDPLNATIHHWYALYLAAFRRFPEAIAQINEAVQLEPSSLPIHYNKGMILIQSGELDAAESELHDAIALEPSSPVAYGYLAIASEKKKDYAKAAALFTEAQEHSHIPLHYAAGIAHAEAMRGNRKRAEQLLDEMLKVRRTHPELVGAYGLTLVYLGLGDKEDSLKWLEQAVADKTCTATELNTDSNLDLIRTDPRFTETLANLHLSNTQ